jgi:hypothetical protein
MLLSAPWCTPEHFEHGPHAVLPAATDQLEIAIEKRHEGLRDVVQVRTSPRPAVIGGGPVSSTWLEYPTLTDDLSHWPPELRIGWRYRYESQPIRRYPERASDQFDTVE